MVVSSSAVLDVDEGALLLGHLLQLNAVCHKLPLSGLGHYFQIICHYKIEAVDCIFTIIL